MLHKETPSKFLERNWKVVGKVYQRWEKMKDILKSENKIEQKRTFDLTLSIIFVKFKVEGVWVFLKGLCLPNDNSLYYYTRKPLNNVAWQSPCPAPSKHCFGGLFFLHLPIIISLEGAK